MQPDQTPVERPVERPVDLHFGLPGTAAVPGSSLARVQDGPAEATGAPDPEWLALLEAGRRGGADGAEAICDAYSRGLRVGLDRATALHAAAAGLAADLDVDPELADALGAATSLPRSELLPEVRRLVAAHNSRAATSLAACAEHSAHVEAMAEHYDQVREALHRKRQALAAERAQWQAELANLRQLIFGRADAELLTVADVRHALRTGPGLVEPTNATERAEDTVRRFAGELWRLASGLADRGIPLRDGEVQGAAVDTALAEIGRLQSEHDRLVGELRAAREAAPSLPTVVRPYPQDCTGHGVPVTEQATQRRCLIEEPHAGHRWYADGTPLVCGGQP